MKANRKFLNDEEAVSPVIAVILMVAITVVLAATVYVWVSGFGNQSGSTTKTMSLSTLDSLAGGNQWKNYTVASASTGLKYSDIKLIVDGDELAFTNGGTDDPDGLDNAKWWVKRDAGYQASTAIVKAGDIVIIKSNDVDMDAKKLTLTDSASNSVMLTLTVS